MSEGFPTTPGQVDPTVVSDELLQQQAAILEMVESRINSTPAPDWQAGRVIRDLGLEDGKYDVFTDSEAPLSGGFSKVVSKEDPSDTLVGLSWMHRGGNMADPTNAIHNNFLRPNGDMVGSIYSENSKGSHKYVINEAANSSDPERAAIYERRLAQMHRKAQELIAPQAERPRQAPAPEVTAHVPKSRVRSWLGRFSLR